MFTNAIYIFYLKYFLLEDIYEVKSTEVHLLAAIESNWSEAHILHYILRNVFRQ